MADKKDWYVEAGDFEILGRSSSADVRLRKLLRVVYSRQE